MPEPLGAAPSGAAGLEVDEVLRLLQAASAQAAAKRTVPQRILMPLRCHKKGLSRPFF